ncbi:MAG TPA: T9SS type A sorting domain-containing protein [Ignavibacteriales bacterium]|nr:T9SS type A sorting domain-containing protein [Ignavibacteriales bacterium]
MRLISTAIFLVFFSLSPVFAQLRLPFSESNKNESYPKESYPVDGTHLLDKQEQMVRDYIKLHPDALAKMRLGKTSAWNFQVGSTKAWNSQDLTKSYPGSIYQVPSTCRKVGTYCYIFVEDELWGNRVTQASVDSVALYFDHKTPADPNKGIYQTDVEDFGDIADVDADPRVIILIEDIKDGYSGSGGYVAGYFTGLNEVNMTGSNHAEMYYLDGNPGNLSSQGGLLQAISTTAHEFQHMIFWNYHQSWQQATFINEGCSMLAEINAGFTARGQGGQYGYNNETNYYLMGWRSVGDDKNLIDYSRASRFFLYLRDQFGMGIFKNIVTSSQFGYACFNDALQKTGSTLKLADVFTNFMMANIVDDRSQNPAYGYIYQGLPKPTGSVFPNPNMSSSSNLHFLSGEYLTYSEPQDLNITFTSQSSSLIVKAFETGPSGSKVQNVLLNTPFSDPQLGTGYTTVTFAVINPTESDDNSASTAYSFNSTGPVPPAMELKWDEHEPTGLYKFDTGDTVCVTFDAVKGGRLDSIRVALRRAGSIDGGVWESTGQSRPTPLGKKLASLTASTTLTPSVPYPVPWTNWRGVDLRSKNIPTDKPFAVGFVFGADAAVPGIMVTHHTGSSDPYHSYTYFTPSGSPANWYYLTAGTDTVAIYLIRAYVSFTNVQSAVSKDLRPLSYSLSQNFPNPFNPVTTIRYGIPESGFVTLKVYDMLGNEVASLVNKDQMPGEYTATFDGKNLSSGVYFYKLSQGNFTQTKKLLLMK